MNEKMMTRNILVEQKFKCNLHLQLLRLPRLQYLTHLKSITECNLLLLIKKATIESRKIAKR